MHRQDGQHLVTFRQVEDRVRETIERAPVHLGPDLRVEVRVVEDPLVNTVEQLEQAIPQAGLSIFVPGPGGAQIVCDFRPEA